MENVNLEEISKEKFDVIIIGGGATGLGTAVDSATRGFKTLLIEKFDYSKCTSSRSTKLAHGGVRYLQQGNIKLVFSALHEKLRMQQNAPQLVKDTPFLVPCYSFFDLAFYYVGLKVYDLLGGFFKQKGSKIVSKKSSTKIMKNINHNKLKGCVEYHDAVFDDSRMAVTLLRTFIDNGGKALNYTEAVDFIKEDNKIVGVKIKSKDSDKVFDVRSTCVINATGIFSDSLRKLDQKDSNDVIRMAQGVHLILRKEVFSSTSAMLIPKTLDGRVLFLVPWHNEVICGTTDVKVDKATEEPKATAEEIDFIISNANLYLNKAIKKEDILSVYTGIRPLALDSEHANAKTAKIARDEKIFFSKSNLITITGGKWTTYREMAEKTIDFAINHNILPTKKCATRNLRLRGYMSEEEVLKLPESFRVYGSDFDELSKTNGFNNKISKDLDINEAQVEYSIKYEQAKTVDDFLSRRTSSLFLNAKSAVEAAPKIAELMAKLLNKDESWIKAQIEDFRNIAENYIFKSSKHI